MSQKAIYKILLISKEDNLPLHEEYANLTKFLSAQADKAHSVMDSLEYLMDDNVDIILIDLSIGREDALSFLEHIDDDYENKATPIVLIADPIECDDIVEHFINFNVISISPKMHWDLHVKKLLSFLKIQKLNLQFMQDSLMESEDRGTIDQLTGAYNRYGCEDIFHSLTSRVQAYQEPFSIIMLDIDHFKKVNDTHGHDVGDEVLMEFSKILIDSIRTNDSLVRLGGEEFIIFISNVNLSVGKKIAEALREKIKSNPLSSKKINITSSLSLVQYKDAEEYDAIFKRLDELIYIAKESGRDIVISEDISKT